MWDTLAGQIVWDIVYAICETIYDIGVSVGLY